MFNSRHNILGRGR